MINSGKDKIWNKYNKDIADDRYYYVRSCIRQTFFPGAEATFIRILRDILKKDIYENEHHTTCTGIGYHADVVPVETAMTVVARQFALMKEKGYNNYVPSCITSFGLYSEFIDIWEHFPEIKDRIRLKLKEATGRDFDTPVNLSHPCDIIYKYREDIARKAKYTLFNVIINKPLKVVEHVGCHYAKMFPERGVGGAEYPKVLVGMIEAWGGEVIDYPERRHCCGFGFRQYLVKANRGYSLSASKKKFDSMEEFKPDLILTNCPGCNMFLDRWQYVISEMEGKVYGENGFGIPVLSYEELAGLILGFDPWEIGLQLHQISVEPLLDKMGIKYNIEDKYKSKRTGQQYEKPLPPSNIKFY